MAEICKECYIAEHGGADADRLIMSDDLDLCEWCGEYRPVVVKIGRPGLFSWLKNQLFGAARRRQ